MARGFRRVSPTAEEVAALTAKQGGRRPAVYRGECEVCGARIWLSGLGIGSHNRSNAHNEAWLAQMAAQRAEREVQA